MYAQPAFFSHLETTFNATRTRFFLDYPLYFGLLMRYVRCDAVLLDSFAHDDMSSVNRDLYKTLQFCYGRLTIDWKRTLAFSFPR